MNEKADNNSIIDSVLSGNKEDFLWIVRGYSLFIRSFIASHLYHLDDVDDLTQDVFLAAYQKLSDFDKNCDIKFWLRGIAQNKIKQFYRSRARRNAWFNRFQQEAINIIQDDMITVTSNETNQSIEALLGCITKLPEKLRKVVRARLDGLKPAALAEELSTTVSAVYNLHYRANKLLRNCVEKEVL